MSCKILKVDKKAGIYMFLFATKSLGLTFRSLTWNLAEELDWTCSSMEKYAQNPGDHPGDVVAVIIAGSGTEEDPYVVEIPQQVVSWNPPPAEIVLCSLFSSSCFHLTSSGPASDNFRDCWWLWNLRGSICYWRSAALGPSTWKDLYCFDWNSLFSLKQIKGLPCSASSF